MDQKYGMTQLERFRAIFTYITLGWTVCWGVQGVASCCPTFSPSLFEKSSDKVNETKIFALMGQNYSTSRALRELRACDSNFC